MILIDYTPILFEKKKNYYYLYLIKFMFTAVITAHNGTRKKNLNHYDGVIWLKPHNHYEIIYIRCILCNGLNHLGTLKEMKMYVILYFILCKIVVFKQFHDIIR